MRLIKFISVSVMYLLPNYLISQENYYCATISDVPNIFLSIPPEKLKSSPGAYELNIRVHIMRRTDGTGGRDINEIYDALNTLVDHFYDCNISFCLRGIDEIKSDYFYNFKGFKSDIEGDGKFSNFHPRSSINAIDMYFLGKNGYFFSRASYIGATALVINGYDNLNLSNSISHEVGHCLGLYHTFKGLCETSGCAELVTREPDNCNCESCGDYICDTPADPNNDQLNINLDNCEWNGITCHDTIPDFDANGDFYDPDEKNLMSYSSSLCRKYFTSGQVDRMHSVIANSPVLQKTLSSTSEHLELSNFTLRGYMFDTIKAKNTIVFENMRVSNNSSFIFLGGDSIVFLPSSVIGNDGVNIVANVENVQIDCKEIPGSNKKKKVKKESNEPHQFVSNYNDTLISGANNHNLKIYPNPTTNAINIQYHLPTLSTVSIKLYNSMGHIARTLLNSRLQQAGEYTFTYKLKEATSGLVFCQIEIQSLNTGDIEVFSKNIIVIK